MSSSVRIKLDSGGIQELLKGAEVQGMIGEVAQAKASSAGDGYGSEIHVFKKRAVAHVFPVTSDASRDNYYNNTLLKVVGV